MSAVLDERKYAKLLAARLPRMISNNEEHARLMADVQALIIRGPELSLEERELLSLLATLIEQYESKQNYFAEFPVSPIDVLEHMMDAHGHTAKDLWGILADKGTVSKILSGERSISKAQAKKLAALYHVSASLFI